MSEHPEIIDLINEIKSNFESDIQGLDKRLKDLQVENAELRRRINKLERGSYD